MTTALEPTQPAAPSIFAADPTVVVEHAKGIATVLAELIRDRHLYANIGRKEYVLVEGWTLLGSMVGVFADVEWTRPIYGGMDGGRQPIGWEARAVARTVDGRMISSAEAMCGRDEYAWRNRDDYALRSMAQTRAVSKALRLPLGFIVELAGYSATPAEELPPEGVAGRGRVPAASVLRQQIEAYRYALGMTPDELATIAREHGVGEGAKASPAQLRAIHDRLALKAAGLPPNATADDLPELPAIEETTHDDANGTDDGTTSDQAEA